ncbi:hypothetical protein HPB48_023776 [Haemaphysalis longicornis]|uniref:ABC transporter domain-containing protein n=1 Tax=Haemaphysalis longicornis TaxID=44386 RepID=A0A9J6H5S4_HAELO|nr:hypothetical protein HPB48_023776 [Haemaphysalis longicornis]
MTSAPQRTPAIMPPVVFPASHPLDGWNAGKNGSEFCFVAQRSFLEPIAHRAAEILNVTKVTSLSSMQEVTRHFAKALQSPDKPGPGSLVAVIFNTTLLEMEEKTQKRKVISPLAEGPWVLDYQVRVNGINFDVNVHYRRFLLLPSALVLDSFGEMTHLLPIQYAVDTAYIEAVSTALERPLDYESSGMRELERMFGVSNANYWLSHFLSMETWVAMVGAFALLVLYGEQADERGESTAIIALTNPALVYLVLLCFGALLAVDAMLVSSSSRALRLLPHQGAFQADHQRLSGPVPALVLDGLRTIGEIRSDCPLMMLRKRTPSTLHVAAAAGGGGFKNFASADLTPDNVTIFQLIARALSSCAYTMILIWYIDNVTTCHGTKIAQPYHFLFKRTYWRPPIIVGTPPVATNTTSRHYEPEKEDAKPIMSISNVSKKYEDEPILNNVSLNIFSKQITVLLAPAGSAKTTLMKLITGWSAPDSGTITIGQYDVAQNTEAARRLIGYSPDDPVLFSDLTVEEHLVFFAMGKSLTNDTVRKDASRAIRDMGLTRYRNRCVEDLKAGYRRLLGVTIAMMPFSELRLHKGSDYKADDVESLIQKKHTFPPPRKALDNKGAVVFRLTGDSDKLSITMREIFFALELEKSRLGIDKMGVTVTTLEDVLESVSERRSVPASMPGSHEASAINEPPVVKKGNVAAKGNKAEKIASKMDNDAKPMQDEQIKQVAQLPLLTLLRFKSVAKKCRAKIFL